MGLKPSTIAFDWIKRTPSGDRLHTGMGYLTRSNREFCFIATKGSPTRLVSDVHQVVFVLVGEHSAKPEEVRRRIERLFAGPYLELYGRKPVPGWAVWATRFAAIDCSRRSTKWKPARLTRPSEFNFERKNTPSIGVPHPEHSGSHLCCRRMPPT